MKAVEGHEDVLASSAEHATSFCVRSNCIGKEHDAEESVQHNELTTPRANSFSKV